MRIRNRGYTTLTADEIEEARKRAKERDLTYSPIAAQMADARRQLADQVEVATPQVPTPQSGNHLSTMLRGLRGQIVAFYHHVRR